MTDTVDDDSVGVVGMGYVGTSLSAVLAERGFDIYGVDLNPDIVDRVTAGQCPVEENKITDLFERHAASGRITAATSSERLSKCATVIVTVGTPLSESDPDLSAVEAASEDISERLVEEQTVIYRSTLPAGVTEETVRPILERGSGLSVGEDFHLVFCPERMAEGSAYDDLTTTPVVVGGVTDRCRAAAMDFWSDVGVETVAVSSPTAAELTKLADNWWIDLNIALANEVALLSERLGVDALEVIEAANTLAKGDGRVNILLPGAGVGGSCLVKDPWFVATLGDRHGLDLETPRVSRRVNDRMPGHVVDLLLEELPSVEGRRVAVLGYAFKAGTDDTRNTPAREIVERLREHGAEVVVSDSEVPADIVREETGLRPVRLPEALDGADAVVVVTGHETYRSVTPETLIERVGSEAFVIVDGRHVFDWGAFDDTAVRYRGVGRGPRE